MDTLLKIIFLLVGMLVIPTVDQRHLRGGVLRLETYYIRYELVDITMGALCYVMYENCRIIPRY